FPRRLGERVEFIGVDLEPAMNVHREGKGGAFADADDPQLLGPQHVDLKAGNPGLEGDRGQETGTTAAEDEDALNHWRSSQGNKAGEVRISGSTESRRRKSEACRSIAHSHFIILVRTALGERIPE